MNPPAPLSSRVFTFDFLRILLIAAVVRLHLRILSNDSWDVFTRLEYYAVPLFLVLSFYLTAKYLIKGPVSLGQVKPRLKRLFLPLVFWSLMGFLPHLALLTLPNLMLQILTGELVNTPLYYLNLLILFNVLCYLLTYIRLPYRLAIFLGIMLLALGLQYSSLNYHFFTQYNVVIQRSYGRFFELIPYAMLGIFFATFKEKLQKSFFFLGVFLFGMVGYLSATQLPLPQGFSYQGLLLFFGTISLFSAVLQSSRIDAEKYFHPSIQKHVNTMGKYTFGIYLFHYPLLELLLIFFPVLKQPMAQYSNVFLVVFLGSCFALCIFLDKVTKEKLSFLLR